MASIALRAVVVPVLAGATCFAAGYTSGRLADRNALQSRKLGIQDEQKFLPRITRYLPWKQRVDEDVFDSDDTEEADEEELPPPVKGRKPIFSSFDTIFSFAPNDGYSLAARSRTNDSSYSWSATSHVGSFINTQFKHVVDHPYWVAVPPHGDQMIAYKDVATGDYESRLHHLPVRPDQAPSYVSLVKWLRQNLSRSEDGFMNSQVVCGPGASYFAKTAELAIWHDIPAILENTLIEQREKYQNHEDKSAWIPRILALGAGASYVAIWNDGRYCYFIADDIDPRGNFEQRQEHSRSIREFCAKPISPRTLFRSEDRRCYILQPQWGFARI